MKSQLSQSKPRLPVTYAASGVDTTQSDNATGALVEVLRGIKLDRPSTSVLPSGHYAAVVRLAENLGVAITTDGVGSKLIVAEQTGRFDTVGIDCVAMNVNDVICVGAEPVSMVDYIAVEIADREILTAVATGLRVGAELSGVDIPAGELAVLPEIIRGHPSPRGLDLVGTCIGTVALDQIITGDSCSPGDAIIGLPSSGLHSNGYTLARRALLVEAGFSLDDSPPALSGSTISDVLLEPTAIYVRAILELLG